MIPKKPKTLKSSFKDNRWIEDMKEELSASIKMKHGSLFCVLKITLLSDANGCIESGINRTI